MINALPCPLRIEGSHLFLVEYNIIDTALQEIHLLFLKKKLKKITYYDNSTELGNQ